MFTRVKYLLKNEYIILLAILFLALFLRLYKINNPLADWHSWRQSDTAAVTRIFVDEGIDFLHPKYYDISSIQTGIYNPRGLRLVELPIYNFIHASLIKTFTSTSITLEEWGRLLSIILAVGTSLGLFLIGKRFLGSLGGLLAAFYFSTIPFSLSIY